MHEKGRDREWMIQTERGRNGMEDEMYERGRDIAGMRQTERGRKKGGKEAGSGALPRECAEIFKEAPL